MRLLPDQEGTDPRRAVAPVGIDHLRPARAAIALPRGVRARHREDAAIPRQAALEHRGAVPEREVRGVPPVHLEMRLAEPAVERLARLLRRRRAGALDRREVLRQHDAPLELRRTRIGAAREIQRAAVGPEPLPVARARRRRLADARRRVAPPRGERTRRPSRSATSRRRARRETRADRPARARRSTTRRAPSSCSRRASAPRAPSAGRGRRCGSGAARAATSRSDHPCASLARTGTRRRSPAAPDPARCSPRARRRGRALDAPRSRPAPRVHRA